MDLLIYELTAASLHLGERAKGNIFKTCLRTIPFTAISGALNRHFLNHKDSLQIKAVGFLDEAVGCNRVELASYSPRDRISGISKIPLEIEFLANVRATILVVADKAAETLSGTFQVNLGGMRSHGFGRSELKLRERRQAGNPRLGLLRVRLPEEMTATFGILKVERPVYGYLFKPDASGHSGVYVRSLFEGSRVVAPELLLQATKR